MCAMAAAFSSSDAAGEHDARADRLGDDERVAGAGPALAEHLVRMDEALHREAEDRFLGPDRVAAADHAAGLGDDVCRGAEDGGDRLDRHALGERRDVEGERDRATHREDVTACVRRGDGSEVGRIVDQGREEVRGRHDREVVAHLVDSGVVERGQPDDERRVRRSRWIAPGQRAATLPTWRHIPRMMSIR